MSFKEKFLPFCFLPIFLIVMQNCFAWLSPTNSGNEFKTMASTTTSNVKPTPPTDLKAPTTISKPSDIVNPRYTGNFLLATMHVDGSKITALQDGTFRFTIVKSASDEVLMISGAKGVTTTLATTDYNAYFAAWNNDFKASGINMDVKPLTDNVNNPNFILWHKDGDSHQIKSVLADVQLESYDASSGTATLHFAPLSKTASFKLPNAGKTMSLDKATFLINTARWVPATTQEGVQNAGSSGTAVASLIKKGVKLSILR